MTSDKRYVLLEAGTARVEVFPFYDLQGCKERAHLGLLHSAFCRQLPDPFVLVSDPSGMFTATDYNFMASFYYGVGNNHVIMGNALIMARRGSPEDYVLDGLTCEELRFVSFSLTQAFGVDMRRYA